MTVLLKEFFEKNIGRQKKYPVDKELRQKLLIHKKDCVKWPISKRPNIVFEDQLLLNAGQKYCRMLQGEHSAIFLTFIKLPFVIKIFVLSIFEWPFYADFTVLSDTYQDGTLRYGSLLVRIAELVQCRLQHKLAIGLLLSSNPNLTVPQLFEELIVESECE